METGGGEKLDSQNLRSFLRIKEEDHHNHSAGVHSDGRGNAPGLTLNSVLSDKRGPGEILPRVQSNRTLLDIIREESGGAGYRDGRKSWRHFKDKLRLRRSGSGSAWTSSVPIPASDIPIHHNNSNRMTNMTRRPSTGFGDPNESTQLNNPSSASLQRNPSQAMEIVSGRFEHTSSLAMRRLQRERPDNDDEEEEDEEEEEEEDEGRRSGDGEEEEEQEEGGGEGGEGGGGQPPVRMSLMALLAETDRQMGLDGSAFMLDDDDEEEEEEESGGAEGGEYNTCCVCMVRHKGAALIPCGHTFCRLCSRELLVQRGQCPLCNNYILEILDIF